MKVELLLSMVLVVCTAFYTIINLMMWFENHAARKQKITPFIVAYLQPTDSHVSMVLHIKNIGEGYAKDVRFNVLKDYKRYGDESLLLSECWALKRGVSSFPPQYEITYFIENWCEIGDKNISDCIEFDISYKRMDGKSFTGKYALPLNQITDQNYSDPPGSFIGQIPYYLEKLNSTLKNMKK